jgi:hypothetical protein
MLDAEQIESFREMYPEEPSPKPKIINEEKSKDVTVYPVTMRRLAQLFKR